MKGLISILLFATQAFAQVGSGKLGSFDPSNEEDPSLVQRIWRSYSVVDISPNGNGVVSTKIAYSDNFGFTFQDLSTVNLSVDINSTQSWNHEVSSLLFDPFEPNPNAKWKLVWEKHLVDKNLPGNRDFRYHWIAMKSAATPISPWSNEVKLLAGTLYNPNNTISPGRPLFQLPPELSDCWVLTEPSTLASTDGFYLSMNCARSTRAADTRFPLVKVRRIPGSATLVLETKGNLLHQYDGALFRQLYASIHPDLASAVSFSATELFEKNGKVYLLASPTDANHTYLGCAVFEITNLETATIKRYGSFPQALLYVPGKAGTFRGACTYTKNSIGSGIVMSQFENASPKMFTIVNTGVQVP